MSKKKKLSPMERIAVSLDSIDGSLRRMADSSEESLTAQRQNLTLSTAIFNHTRREINIEVPRPWWKKLMGMS